MNTRDDTLDGLLNSVQKLAEVMAARCRELSRAVLADVRSDTMAVNAQLAHLQTQVELIFADAEVPILGAGFIGAAPVFSRHVLRWWYRPAPGATAKPLAVSTEPDQVGYYDVENTEWWTLAMDTSETVTSGPYVDFAGTNAYVVTFAQSVHRKDNLCGVVVADIAVGELQSRWQEALWRNPRETSIVSADGAVIATNTGSLLGDAIDLDEDDVDRIPVPGSSWLVVRANHT